MTVAGTKGKACYNYGKSQKYFFRWIMVHTKTNYMRHHNAVTRILKRINCDGSSRGLWTHIPNLQGKHINDVYMSNAKVSK